jgi:four helix bundle protein
MGVMFDHEKLKVYQQAVAFVVWVEGVLPTIPKSISVHDQLDRASTSIPLNTAEGNGKYTARDRCRFFDIARGSALECAACLDVLVARKHLSNATAMPGKEMLMQIVSMLVGLIRSNSADRVYEEDIPYGIRTAGDGDGGQGRDWESE